MKRWAYMMVWIETTNSNFTAARVMHLTPQGVQSVDVEGSKDFVKNSRKIGNNAFTEVARLGSEGWELVSTMTDINHATFVFKREMS